MRIQAHQAIEPKKPKCVRGNGASPVGLMSRFAKALSPYAQEAVGSVLWALDLPNAKLPFPAIKAIANAFYSLPFEKRGDAYALSRCVFLADRALGALANCQCKETIASSPELQADLAAVIAKAEGLTPKK